MISRAQMRKSFRTVGFESGLQNDETRKPWLGGWWLVAGSGGSPSSSGRSRDWITGSTISSCQTNTQTANHKPSAMQQCCRNFAKPWLDMAMKQTHTLNMQKRRFGWKESVWASDARQPRHRGAARPRPDPPPPTPPAALGSPRGAEGCRGWMS